MSVIQLIGVAVLAGGILALMQGGFRETRETYQTELGPLELSVEHQGATVSVWAGVGAIVAGGLLLVVPRSD
jgi:hypothetical protein